MKKSLLLFLLLCSIFSFLHGQELAPTASPLAGTYIIGSNQTGANTFKTITAAVTEINNSGVSGPVVFLLNDENYKNVTEVLPGETFPIKINQFPGTSSVNTLTIKPNTGKTVTITGTNINGYTALPAVFQIDGGDNIVIDGSNTANGSSRDLTIVNNDNVSYAARTAVWISSNAANGATNIKVLNLKLQMTNRNQDALQLSGIFSGSNNREGTNGLSGTPATAANSNFTVKNNEFLNVRQGIIVNGNTTPSLQTSNIEFSSNKLGSIIDGEKPARPVLFSSVNNFYIEDNVIDGFGNIDGSSSLAGIRIQESSEFSIKRNIVKGLKINDNSKPSYGLLISGATKNAVISENTITDLENLTTQNIIKGIGIETTSSSTGISLINNFVSKIFGGGPSTNTGHGIYITQGGQGMKIYHNTVAMNVQQPGWSTALTIAAGTIFDVRNNLFTNVSTLPTGYNEISVIRSYSAAAFESLSNNNYFGPRIGRLGNVDYASLLNWQNGTAKDADSKNINPTFVSLTNLHLQTIPTNAGLANAGSNLLAAVPIDIDGQARTFPPEIGADEFAFVVTLAAEPTSQSTSLNFTNVTANSFKLDWTKGTGTGTNSIVVIHAGSAVNSPPVDATAYNANAVFGSGSQIGTGNYVIYGGTANTVTVTGLSAATTYYASVYEYNGDGATANYLTTLPLTGNQKTLNANLGWQIVNTNTQNKITFDTTVSGVNNGSYLGTGFLPTAGSGQLDSNGWAVEGFEDGAIAFGGINTNLDFRLGKANGPVTNGGIYAFETSPNNQSLGIQPSTTDFVPGSVTLRFQNQTGVPIDSISIGYKVYIYNDEAASSSFNFSHSANNSSFTSVPQLDVISPAAADVNPSWKASYRVATIKGLNIGANEFYYLKWTGDKITPNGPYDQFGLDDIVLSANPTTVFADFEGIAENFSINGNTSLSGNTTVNGDLKFTAGKLSINDQTLTLGGTVINTVDGGNFKGSANSNISIIGNGDKNLSFDQTTQGTTNVVNNFLIPYAASVAKTVSLSNPLVINGAVNVGLDQVLNMGTTPLNGILASVTVNGTLRTQNVSTLPFPEGINFLGTTGTVIYDGATAQTLASGTYNNLTVSNLAGVTAAGNVIANGTVDLPSVNPNPNPSAIKGRLDMSTFILTMGADATNTGNGDVTGIVTRNTIIPNVLYTFGHPNTSILFPNVGTLPTSLSLKTQIGTAPSWKPEAIKRIYDLIQTGAAGTKAVIRGHYLDSELNGNTENKLVDWAHTFDGPGNTLEQGRSNFNTEENWVTLTNADISRFFTSEFGKVNLTFADSKAAFLTWNGSKSNSWNTAGNWTAPDGTLNDTPNKGTVIFIPNESNTPNDPLITGGQEVLSITIQEGGIVNTVENIITPPLFTVYGGAGAWINNGTFNAGNSTVIFNNLDATIAGKTDFNNVTIASGAGLRPLTDNIMRIKGALNVQGIFTAGALDNTVEYTGTNQAVVVPGGLAAAYHNITITGTGAVFPTSLKINGDLTIDKPVDFMNKTIVMSGLDLQSITGSNANFNDVEINNSGEGVNLGANAVVNGTLRLTNGVLDIGDFNLTLGQNPVAGSFNVNKMIVADGKGFVRRPFTTNGSYEFPIGERTSNPAYSPITVNVTAGTFNDAYVSVSVVDAIHINNNSLQNYISRYWNVKQTGISGAVATIEANYLPQELLTPVNTMIAGQLTGIFNADTNPWKRFSELSGLTLTAAGAPLEDNQVSVFTGIKGGEFNSAITGGDTTCQNDAVTLSANVTGGDKEYTYLWSPVSEPNLGTEATFSPPKFIGTKDYTVIVTDANGRKTNATKTVTTVASAVAGTVSGNQTACFSFAPDALKVSGNLVDIAYWQRSDNAEFSNPININNASSTLPSFLAGEIIGTTYFRAAVKNGSCGDVFTDALVVDTKSTVLTDTGWSNGIPDNKTSAIISIIPIIPSTYNLPASLNACSLTITAGSNVVVPPTIDVVLNGSLIVANGASFALKSNTNLVQISNERNFGKVTVERESSKLYRLDYTMWGSPVTGTQTLKDFSPRTVSNRFYIYNSSTDLFNTIAPTTNSFTTGKGYLIRMPDNHVAYGSATPELWSGTFDGTPNTGNISIDLNGSTTTGTYTSGGFNMIANPYASMINADAFLDQNIDEIDGTLYFWRRRNAKPDESAYYATYTLAGGTGTAGSASAPTQKPNGFIQVGQGFIVKKATTTPQTGKALFTNSMRTAANEANQIFKNSTPNERNRIWLNVSNTAGEFGQTLVAYMPSATNEIDRTDGKYLGDGSTALTSWLNDTRYIIQGRAPFSTSDVVPLNFETASAGIYTIAIDHVDGLFEGNQNIYLRDRFHSVTHNLKNASYTFETAAGSFNSRFEIVYESGTLVVDNPEFTSNKVVVYKKDGDLIVKAKGTTLDTVEVFDFAGRLLATAKNIKSDEVALKINNVNQVLIVKITSTEGKIITKKLINN